MSDTIKPDKVLDAKELKCPLPLLKTKKVIEKMGTGQILEVLGTDPGSKIDLPGWCARAGHNYLGVKEERGLLRFYIKKG